MGKEAIKNQSQLRDLRQGLDLRPDEAQVYCDTIRMFVANGVGEQRARELAVKSLRPEGRVVTKAESTG